VQHLSRPTNERTSLLAPVLSAGRGFGQRRGGRLCAGEERRVGGPRAQRASSTDSRRLFERSGRSPRSEFRRGAAHPSTAADPSRSEGLRIEAHPAIARTLGPPAHRARSPRSPRSP